MLIFDPSNIWSPEEQKETVKVGGLPLVDRGESFPTNHLQAITTQYGVSERLQGLMCTEPVLPRPQAAALSQKRESRSREFDLPQEHEHSDLETALRAKESIEMDERRDLRSFRSLTFAQVTDQIWHFSSTDYGPRCR